MISSWDCVWLVTVCPFHLVVFNLLRPRKPDNQVLRIVWWTGVNNSQTGSKEQSVFLWCSGFTRASSIVQLVFVLWVSRLCTEGYLGLLILGTWVHFPFIYGSPSSDVFWNVISQSWIVYFIASAHRAIWDRAKGLNFFSFNNIQRTWILGDGGPEWKSIYTNTCTHTHSTCVCLCLIHS